MRSSAAPANPATKPRGTSWPGCCRPGKPAHTRDLAAQTIGLCLIDTKRDKLAGKIQANVKQLLSLQRASGHWSVKFDPNYPITEMQTGESLYALALAGLERRPSRPCAGGSSPCLAGSRRSAAGSTSTPTSSSARRFARRSGP